MWLAAIGGIAEPGPFLLISPMLPGPRQSGPIMHQSGCCSGGEDGGDCQGLKMDDSDASPTSRPWGKDTNHRLQQTFLSLNYRLMCEKFCFVWLICCCQKFTPSSHNGLVSVSKSFSMVWDQVNAVFEQGNTDIMWTDGVLQADSRFWNVCGLISHLRSYWFSTSPCFKCSWWQWTSGVFFL